MLLFAGVLLLLSNAALAAPTSMWLKSVYHYCSFAPDDTVRVEVMLNSVNDPIDDLTVAWYHYPDRTTFIRAERGALTASWSNWNTTYVQVGPGPNSQITVDATGPAIPTGTSGHFATLVFVVKVCDTLGTGYHRVDLCFAQTLGDIEDIDERCGEIYVMLTPPPPGRLIVQSLYQSCGSAQGDTVEINVRLETSPQAVDAAGLDIPFDPAQLEYVGFERGDLTAAWPFFDAAVLLNSTIRVGGFTQTPIPAGTSGSFVTLRFVVHCCGSSVNNQLCAQSLVDDFAGMNNQCGVVRCQPLATRSASWGHVKALYR